MDNERKDHWETVYQTKTPDQVSWTQSIPKTSLEFIRSFGNGPSASVIDIGGGDSHLVDFLLDEGYTDVTVLDISARALERAKARLGKKASMAKWIVSDIIDFTPARTYDIWHDRAAFHFLIHDADKQKYLETAEKAVNKLLVIGTFSDNGPIKCSGLEITQYSGEELQQYFARAFDKLACVNEDHTTPFGTTQNFSFCSFRKKI